MIAENSPKQHKTYISGKTSGIPIEHVQQKFDIAESFLISIGMVPINPIKNGLTEKHSKKQHLIKDIQMLLNSNTIFVLDNWIDSKQSRIEIKIAEEYGIPIMFESNACKNIGKIEKLKDAITHVMGLKFDDLITKSRTKETFFARMIIINYCRETEKMSLYEIGQIVNRDHTTVMHGIKTYRNEIKYNSGFRDIVSKIDSVLTRCVSE
jgi:hypothetical protein